MSIEQTDFTEKFKDTVMQVRFMERHQHDCPFSC